MSEEIVKMEGVVVLFSEEGGYGEVEVGERHVERFRFSLTVFYSRGAPRYPRVGEMVDVMVGVSEDGWSIRGVASK
jgi:hypothetical protein